MTHDPYCAIPDQRPVSWIAAPGEPVAACTLCGEPTLYRATAPGAPQCPRCEWQQAQRAACSG